MSQNLPLFCDKTGFCRLFSLIVLIYRLSQPSPEIFAIEFSVTGVTDEPRIRRHAGYMSLPASCPHQGPRPPSAQTIGHLALYNFGNPGLNDTCAFKRPLPRAYGRGCKGPIYPHPSSNCPAFPFVPVLSCLRDTKPDPSEISSP